MEYDNFWSLMADVAALGSFICAVPSEGGSANILGEFEVRSDGRENVFQVKSNKDHVHLDHNRFSKLSFGYFNVGYGDEPLITLLNENGKPMMKLYYTGDDAKRKYSAFVQEHSSIQDMIEGEW